MVAVQSILPSPRRSRGLNHRDWADIGLPRMLDLLGVSPDMSADLFAEMMPFSLNDTTAGAENELQTVVIGGRDAVDFPLTIENSNYFRNLVKRAAAGDTSRRLVSELEAFLSDNTDGVWENSWVRFPRPVLGPYARRVFEHDLLSDKCKPEGPCRKDRDRFVFTRNGEAQIRIPVSYLLKLALADVVDPSSGTHPAITAAGERFMNHFLNDNTSPETFSFYPVLLTRSSRMGKGIARETLKRFLLCQLLTIYANRRFRLQERGQRVVIYFAPNTHHRQKRLNDLISDSFYRELYMSPCLCGWNQGEEKHRYMGLCHQVLSRSQLNAISKLREAGIITRNLVVLPSVSNISLANNGTHISLGSRRLTALMADSASGFGPGEEKYLGDLVIKIVEHFLPLFVGTYSAAPYRLDFWDFHPEKLLGFLPHELDFTHLRMLWRRWKKKARLKVLGHPVTPFGPRMLDRWISRLFCLQGDFVQDFRLMDYFVALMSTCESPALDGCLHNEGRLKQDLTDFGVFDTAMPMYLLYRLRDHQSMGFSGFEGRYYSLFENMMNDMGSAASLQTLITALAYHYILKGQVHHADIPDDPVVESERRQIFFGSAIGIPTFYVHRETRNRFMKHILSRTARIRLSRRYPGYLRVYNMEYRRALLSLLREDGAHLIGSMGLDDTVRDLADRVASPPPNGASERLTKGILDQAGVKRPMSLSGGEFNTHAERYYRETLRLRHFREALDLLEQDFRNLDAYAILRRDIYPDVLLHVMENGCIGNFLERVRADLLREEIDETDLTRLIHLTLLSLHSDLQFNEARCNL